MKTTFPIKKLNAKERVAIQNERNCARKFHMDQNWQRLIKEKLPVTRIVHDPKWKRFSWYWSLFTVLLFLPDLLSDRILLFLK